MIMRFQLSSLAKSWMPRSLALAVAACSFSVENVNAQFNAFNGGQGVGGVLIDAEGVLRTLAPEEESKNLEQLRRTMAGAQGDLAKQTDLRLISLKGIQQILVDAQKAGKPIPEEVHCLGGLTRIDYVMLYPERQDIVLAGPAEPWTIGPQGSLVGKVSGNPIVNLDDLVTAFRYVSQARNGGVSVSIEPTEQGVRQFNQALRSYGGNTPPTQLASVLAKAFGPQQIKLSGIPEDSHMARVILAADYRMKLYGMNLAKAPVAGLPSYLEMVKNKANASTQLQSRFWMACDYDAISHSKDKLAWKISGQRIKTLTEQDAFDANGASKQTGKVDQIAKKWADNFTTKMNELAVKDTVFGELRNVMDLCVIAALIESQNMQSAAGCNLSALLGEQANLPTVKFDVAQALDPQISFVQTAQNFVVSASGGVSIESWYIASNIQENDAISPTRTAGIKWESSTSWYQ
jgi:hypothetical protein